MIKVGVIGLGTVAQLMHLPILSDLMIGYIDEQAEVLKTWRQNERR